MDEVIPANAKYCHGVDNVKRTLSELLVVTSSYSEGNKDSVEVSVEGVVYYYLHSPIERAMLQDSMLLGRAPNAGVVEI